MRFAALVRRDDSRLLRTRRVARRLLVLVVLLILGLVLAMGVSERGRNSDGPEAVGPGGPGDGETPSPPPGTPPGTPPSAPGAVDPEDAERAAVRARRERLAPWMIPAEGSLLHGRRHGLVDGFLGFRGNPTRTFYGDGPVPRAPVVLWRYPDAPMCSIEGDLEDGGRRWCGIGWTGQPLVLVGGARTDVIVGGYDGGLHFVDAADGRASRVPFFAGQMVKGTETIDPDGFPLVYTGARDGYLRIVAFDRDVPTELWRLGRHPQGVWNNDWDANPTVHDDVLYAAGEDGWFRVVRINRRLDAAGLVQVDPVVLLEVAGFNDELIARVGDRAVSIESSPALTDTAIYWVNSGGRVMGIDRAAALEGREVVILDHWVGDDADASIVVDRDGALYVAVEVERRLAGTEDLGQLIKLDPARPNDPVVWRLTVRSTASERDPRAGIWATPAIHGELLYVPTHAGDLLIVDRSTGSIVHEFDVGYHAWSPPAIVEDVDGSTWLVVATCSAASLRGYELVVGEAPIERWRVPLPGCIESTPVVWRGAIYVGSRDGYLYAVGDPRGADR